MSRRRAPKHAPVVKACRYCKSSMISTGIRDHERACIVGRATQATDFQRAVYCAFREAVARAEGKAVTLEAIMDVPLADYTWPEADAVVEAIAHLDGVGLVVAKNDADSGKARHFTPSEETPQRAESVRRLTMG